MSLAAANTPTPKPAAVPAPRVLAPGLTLMEEHTLLNQLRETNFMMAQLAELMRTSADKHALVHKMIRENEDLIRRLKPQLPPITPRP